MANPLNTVKGKRPDITPIQVLALIPIIANLLRAFGVFDLSKEQEDALRDTMEAAIGLVGADVLLRGFRNYTQAKTETAATFAEADIVSAHVKNNGGDSGAANTTIVNEGDGGTTVVTGHPDTPGDDRIPDHEIEPQDVTAAFSGEGTETIAGFEDGVNPDDLPVDDDPLNDPDDKDKDAKGA